MQSGDLFEDLCELTIDSANDDTTVENVSSLWRIWSMDVYFDVLVSNISGCALHALTMQQGITYIFEAIIRPPVVELKDVSRANTVCHQRGN